MGSCRRWHYGGPNSTKLSGAAFASRLEDGNTLITDSNNSRIVEVTPGGKVVWQYVTNTRPGERGTTLPDARGALEEWEHFDQRPIQPSGH